MVESTINLEQLFAEPPEEPKHGGCSSCGTGKALASEIRCGNGLEKIYPTTAARFGYMRYIGEFSHPADMRFSCGAKVIIQTKRGIELGEQVSLTCNGCDKSVTRDQMRSWVESSGEDSFIFEAGRILREATAADLAEDARMKLGCRAKRNFCQQLAKHHGLPIKVVECESLFGGERILFYFTAAERVDFRGIVKELAHEYRTRIEMRQIGARDEARLLADFETCGREVCCKVFLKTLRPISMRMAKVQKATLDPSQVSGRCGRLKCCLRYEHVGYEELDKRLPRNGIRIRTEHGDGVIVNRQILTQLVQIRTDEGKMLAIVAEDILEVGVKPPEKQPEPEPRERSRGGRGGSEQNRSRRPRQPRPAPPQDKDKETQDVAGHTASTAEPDAPPVSEAPPATTDGEQPPPQGDSADGATTPSRRRRSGRRRRGGKRRRKDGNSAE